MPLTGDANDTRAHGPLSVKMLVEQGRLCTRYTVAQQEQKRNLLQDGSELLSLQSHAGTGGAFHMLSETLSNAE